MTFFCRRCLTIAITTFLAVCFASTHTIAGEDDDGLPTYYPTEELTDDDLIRLSLRELSLMRNTIFARAGHEFSTDWLADHFEAQPWYEGGGMDSDQLSELDKKNAATLREFEQNLDELELRYRRWRHWPREDIPDDGEWTPPGPFDDDEDVIEAKLIDDALDKFLTEQELFRRRSDPGEQSVEIADSDTDIPDELGGLSLGETLDPSRIDDIGDETRPLGLLDRRGQVYPVLDADGRIEQLVYRGEQFSSPNRYLRPGERRVYTPTKLLTELVEKLGPPEGDDVHHRGRNLGDERWVWRGDEHTVEFDLTHYVEGDLRQTRVTLRTNEPSRICGPDDGFEEWYEEFQKAMASDDPEQAVDYFDFPVPDRGIREPPADPGSVDRGFESREDFLNRSSLEKFPFHGGDPSCINDRSGYGVGLASAVGGALYFTRIDGDWKASEIILFPFWRNR